MKRFPNAFRSLFALALIFLCISGHASDKANTAAAVNALQRAVGYLAAGEWDLASFEARLGSTYDSSIADFSYIESLSLLAQKKPLALAIENAEKSLTQGLLWRSYHRDDAVVLCARLYGETARHTDALYLLESNAIKNHTSSDADFVRIRSLYATSNHSEARKLLSAALNRWPFDGRFPRVFLTVESPVSPDPQSRILAQTILDRLYIWENEDRDLLLLAVPFLHDPQDRVRYIRMFRGMGKNDMNPAVGGTADVPAHPVATIRALEYGLISESLATAELFSLSETGIPRAELETLFSLIGSQETRNVIASYLASYSGRIVDLPSYEGTYAVTILYRYGRPYKTVIDANYDGLSDFTIDSDLGAPILTESAKDGARVTYDTYPYVNSLVKGGREFTLKPLSLSWEPVRWISLASAPGNTPFYVLTPTNSQPPLTDTLIYANAVFSLETDPQKKGGIVRNNFDRGMIVSSESRMDGRPYSWTTYSRGYPSLTRTDRDGDAFFETTITYTLTGEVSSVTIDANGNRRTEYREDYFTDGSRRLRWDSDENGYFEISWTVSAEGMETLEWLHPVTGIPAVLISERGKPRSLRYGETVRTIIKDPAYDLWWINSIPPSSASLAKSLIDAFNRQAAPVVTHTITFEGKRLHGVMTGGLLFVEMLDD